MNISHIRQTEITNIGDPFVLRVNDEFYLYATSFIKGFYCWHSKDMMVWDAPVHAYDPTETGFGSLDFWAPEVIEHDGKFIMHYTARRKSDDTLLIGVAVSDHPLGPFKDVVPHEPMFDFGYAAIDGHVLRDGEKNYLFYSRDCSQHVVEGRHESHLMAVEIDDTLTKVIGEPVAITHPEQPWETVTGDFRWNEGAFIVKRGGLYYLMYSSGFYAAPTYGIGYAVSKNALGPYVKAEENPVLHSVEGVISGPGHNSVVRGLDGVDYCVFHVHTNMAHPSEDRKVCLCPVSFENGKVLLP